MTLTNKTICFVCSGSIERIAYYNKLLFDYFSQAFQEVVYLDISNVFTTWIRRKISNDKEAGKFLPKEFKLITPKSLKELKGFLRSRDLVVISFFAETWEDWYIYYYLKKYKIPLIYIHTLSSIVNFQYNIPKKEFFLIRSLRKFFKALPYRIFRALILSGVLTKVDTYFISNKIRAQECKMQKFSRYNDIVVTNSRFYDGLLKNNYNITNEFIIFLDSMVPDHGDQKNFGFQNIDRQLYYINLNRILDILSSTLNKEIVVCLHPKYDEANLSKDFKGKVAIKYKTDEYVARAELVLFHETSAINLALAFRKKIIQLTGSKFNNFLKKNCLSYQEAFSLPTIDIFSDDENHIRKVVSDLNSTKDQYDSFLSNYIIASGEINKPSYVQIAEHLSRKYGVKING